MISTINFENHINRFLETMRGVQRILFVGTGICIENYPVLAGEKWKCIYTTNQSDRLADTFSRAERQVRPIYTKHEYDSARTKLDQNNPLLVFINGRASKENDDEDIDQEVERRENSKLLLKSMTSLLKSDLMVELVIVGYNPQDNGELSPYDLYAELRLLSDNRVTFYGVTPEIAANKYIKKLANDGIVTLFAQDLGEALENRCSVADNDSEDSPVVTHDVENANNTVYIDGHPVVLDASLCYDFNKYGRVLSVREMATGTISRMMQTEFFYQFLKRSPHTPQWYGYAKRNSFAVPREFEDELYEKVHDGLEKNSETLVVLVGQTSSGKSVALAALAFRLFQERKYPVLFVNNPDVTFAKHSAAALALDNILKEIRDNGGRAIVILDWSVYNLQRSDTIGRIAYQFNNRGQNVLFVASAMTAVAETIRYVTVSAPIDLTASEKNRFKDLLVEKGKLPRNKVEQWMCRHENENGLLSMLYRLVYELHPQLELGLKKEITKALADTVEGIMELEDPIPEQKPLSSIAAQLLKLGLIDLPDTYTQEQVHSIKTSIINSLQAFCEGLAVASLFKLRMPITMAMHLLQIPECSNRQQYRDVVFNAPWLHYALDDDKYSPGEYYVSFRDPMDARIYLHSINKSEADMLQIVAAIIRTMSGEKDSFYSDEVKFLERLIRMIGPNSDDQNVRVNWYGIYGPGCNAVIEALADLRREGIVEPQLVAQEITYIREYYGNDCQQNLSVKSEWLGKAIQIAQNVLDMVDHPDVETAHWQQGLIDSITVESIFAELQLEKCQRQMAESGSIAECSNIPMIHSYRQKSNMLLAIINAQPENSYAYTALLSCFVFKYENASVTEEMLADMSTILEILDITEASIPQVESNDHYQRKKAEFLSIFDYICGGNRMERYFESLLTMGSAVGVHIQAKSILRKAGIDYNRALDCKSEAACEKALKLLESKQYEHVVSNHAACQYMRLNLTWLYYNKRPVFEHERQYTKLTKEQWTQLYKICNEFKCNIIENQPGCSYRASVYYIMALACAQLGQYDTAVQIWQDVREEDFFSVGRQYTWHILCTPDGEPMLFTGTFNVRMVLQERRIYIKELGRPVLYPSLQSINKSDTTGEAANLCIGTSYRGFSAFACNWKVRRD